MFDRLLLMAQRDNSPVNVWLRENPLVTGLLFVAIGGVLLFFGVKELKSGVARDKYGNEVSGGLGKVIAIVRVIGGVIAAGFGLMKLVGG